MTPRNRAGLVRRGGCVGLFVAGTDTAVGKTFVASRIAAARGMAVVMADIEQAALDRAAAEVAATGAEVVPYRVDVSSAAEIDAMAEATRARFGAPHFVFNNAGVGSGGLIWEVSLRDWQWVLGVNLMGVVHGVRAFTPMMLAAAKQDRSYEGHIVNTASMAGLIASKGLGVYNTSKYAVVGLSETLVKDLKPYRIGVSVLCPLGVETRIRDSERNRPAALRNERAERVEPVELMGRSLSPESVADMVLAAIRANELYVITHDESLEPLRRRFERMERSILDRRR